MSSSSLPIIQDILAGRLERADIFKSGPGSRAILAHDLIRRGRDVALIVNDQKELSQVRAILRLLGSWPDEPTASITDSRWLLFPAAIDQTPAALARRLACLYALRQHCRQAPTGRPGLGILLGADNFLPRWPAPDITETQALTLNRGDEISTDMILEQAVMWGYQRVPFVTRPGELAVRGDILDIYSPAYELPLRLELFGDSIEDMRLFEVASQRSRAEIETALILPVTDIPATPALRQAALARWEKKAGAGGLAKDTLKDLTRCLDLDPAAIPVGLYYDQTAFIEDLLPSGAVRLLADPLALEEGLKNAENELKARWAEPDKHRPVLPPSLALRPAETALPKLEQGRRLVFPGLYMGLERNGLDLAESPLRTFEEALGREAAADYKERPWQSLVRALKHWTDKRRQVILSFHTAQARKKFISLAGQESLSVKTDYSAQEPGLYALISPLQQGLDLEWAGLVLLPEDILQPSGLVRRPRKAESFVGLNAYSDLEEGDLLIHRDYGLGAFAGLSHLKVGDTANDFLVLKYSGNDTLYVPVFRLDLVQRYQSPSDESPALDRLGGPAWSKSRERARKAIEKIALDLVEMYAYRKVAKGYSYGPINEMYRDFEASFGFEETVDQARAIADVLTDMERPQPMDRLVCGDVGFGKTEVAMRAAFRATLDGKQVAILCPTTILAEQHYQNFRSRMKDFPVNVDMLSRFVPNDQQKRIAESAALGRTDILIGTHRLLSKDISLPNLGLLVLDEEQRFGVRQKERLKSLRKDVDVLTLTATPIPRTLQLSLSGIRELSLIESPPAERKAVATAIIERDEPTLKNILERELERQGQVFWVHNRISGLDRVLEFVSKLVPQARIAVAHGQMAERQLEDTMHRFWHGELDILICTAIIESGLDFPRANTIVIDQAQQFGLAQLYQLRGRVGRSERQAYAYLVVPQARALSEIAEKRLHILQDMDFLGAGFQVAQEDLRLRGAGNILGEVQSGSIAKIGLEMFLEMLEEEVQRLRGEKPRTLTEPELSLAFSAIIPENYVTDPRERLRYYKGLASAVSRGLREDLIAEIYDRFGPAPEEFQNLLEVLNLKTILSRLGVTKAELAPNRARLSWPDDGGPDDPEKLIRWVAKNAGTARFSPPAALELRLGQKGSIREELAGLAGLLSELAPEEHLDHP